MMAALIPPIYQALLGVGFLALLTLALVAFFWRAVEWRLLCWLERRRRERETSALRLGLRRPR